MRLLFFCPYHWDPAADQFVPGLTSCHWGTAGQHRPIPCYWFFLPNLFAN